MTMWKRIKIDGVDVEFPEEILEKVSDELEEELEKARRRRKKKEEEEVEEGEKEKTSLDELLARIRRRLAELEVSRERSARTLFKARRELPPLEERRKALKEREEKYGYKAGRNAHLTKPKEYADVPESQFADPVGYNYPVNTPKRARAALAYFIRFHDQYDDVNAKIFIYERILRALKKFGIKRHFNPDFPGDWLMPQDLKEWMEGYDKYADKDTEEMREKMLRRWGKKERRRLAKQASYLVAPTPGAVAVDEDKIPSLQRELSENLISQFESAIEKVLSPALSEFLEAFAEELKEFMETFVEALDTLAEAIKESAEGYKEALEDATSEIRAVVGEEEKAAVEEVPPAGTEEEETPPEGAPPEEGVAPEEIPLVGEEEGEEKVPEKGAKLMKEIIASDLLDEWNKWFGGGISKSAEGKEEEGIVVDLEKHEILGDIEEIAETGVRFVDPESGKVSKKLEKGAKGKK